MERYANIVATGRYLPENEMPNDELRRRFVHLDDENGTSVIDKFEASTGIRTRWYAPEDWASSDLAVLHDDRGRSRRPDDFLLWRRCRRRRARAGLRRRLDRR